MPTWLGEKFLQEHIRFIILQCYHLLDGLRKEHVEVALQECLRSEFHYRLGLAPSYAITKLKVLTDTKRILVGGHRGVINGVQRAQAVKCYNLVAVLEARGDRDLCVERLQTGLDVRRRMRERALAFRDLLRCRNPVQEVYGGFNEVDMFAHELRNRVRVAACASQNVNVI